MIIKSSYPARGSEGTSSAPLTWEEFLRLWRAADEFESVDDYIAHVGGEIGDRSARAIIHTMEAIYSMAWGDAGTLIEARRVSAAEFARKFGLSDDVVKSWCCGRRQPTEPMRALLAYAITNDIITA